jgi:uncharacterized damage-inducible protein DinB
MNRELIDRYEDGGRKLAKAVEHLDRNDLVAVPVPGKWSIQQLVAHVGDTDLVFTERIKRVIAEDRPPLLAFDENKWAKALQYEMQSTPDAIELLALNRRVMANLLRALPPEAFARVGLHSERGEMSLEQLLTLVTNHLDHHLKFLYEKREAMGKMMW